MFGAVRERRRYLSSGEEPKGRSVVYFKPEVSFKPELASCLSWLGTGPDLGPGFGRLEAGEGSMAPQASLWLLSILKPSWGSRCLAGPLHPGPAPCQGRLSQKGPLGEFPVPSTLLGW